MSDPADLRLAAPAPVRPQPSRRWRSGRIHPAWLVAAVAFVALIGAAGFRAAPGVLIVPLEDEFGWSRSVLSAAVSVNLVLFGLTAPFAAALMDRFGLRRVTAIAFVLVAIGSGATVWMTASWQLVLCWGVLIGLGTGSMALVFAASVAQRWFVRRRGLVVGVLTAGSATGQLIFLPLMAWLAESYGWRLATLVITTAALAVVPLVLLLLRDSPADLGVRAYGAEATDDPEPAPDGPTPELAMEPGAAQLASTAGIPRVGPARVATSGVARRGSDETVLGARDRVRDLRREHERDHRHALHPGRP